MTLAPPQSNPDVTPPALVEPWPTQTVSSALLWGQRPRPGPLGAGQIRDERRGQRVDTQGGHQRAAGGEDWFSPCRSHETSVLTCDTQQLCGAAGAYRYTCSLAGARGRLLTSPHRPRYERRAPAESTSRASTETARHCGQLGVSLFSAGATARRFSRSLPSWRVIDHSRQASVRRHHHSHQSRMTTPQAPVL